MPRGKKFTDSIYMKIKRSIDVYNWRSIDAVMINITSRTMEAII